MNRLLIVLLALFPLLSCSYSYSIKTLPPGAELKVNGTPVESGVVMKSKEQELTIELAAAGYITYRESHHIDSPFTPLHLELSLTKRSYKVAIDLIDGTSDIFIDGVKRGINPLELELTHGEHLLELERKEFNRQKIELQIEGPKSYLFRHQQDPLPFRPLGIYSCESQPKQVLFSPDSRYIYIPLLDGEGFQIFDREQGAMKEYLKPAATSEKRGFVEGLFISDKESFFVSQMTGGLLYEYSMLSPTVKQSQLKRSLKTGGVWSKFIAWSPQLNLLAVSNWSSSDVTLLDYKSGKIVKRLQGLATPRGLCFSPEGSYLYITSFEGGTILKYSTKSWQEVGRIYKGGAAMRHVVLSSDGKKGYVSNMAHNEIYTIDTEKFKIEKSYKVYYNPNTIELTPDDKRLFVSSRGPNNSKGYLNRSPVNGKVTVIDLEKEEILCKIEGGNQTTGLDISPDGNFLVFSNFKDDNIEIYDISVGE